MKSTFITDIQHEKIRDLAISETTRRGKFISIQDVIEEAVDLGLFEIDKRKAAQLDGIEVSK